MRRVSFSFIACLVFISFLVTPGRVAAQITPTAQARVDCIESELGCIPADVGKFVQQYYVYGLSMIGGLALLFIIYGGYTVLTSRGNPQQLNSGKGLIGYALAGLLLAIFGYLFTEVIVKDILRIPGIT
jgi:hypothetical protein